MMNQVTFFFVILFIACGFSCLTLFSRDDVGTIGINDRPEKVFSFIFRVKNVIITVNFAENRTNFLIFANNGKSKWLRDYCR